MSATTTSRYRYDAPPDLDHYAAAPLRDGSVVEKVLRGIAALLVVVGIGLAFAHRMAQPRDVDDVYALLYDVNAGRVARVGTDHPVVWERHDGTRYRTHASGIDVAATLAEQPYVRQHPGAIAIGRRIDLGPLESGAFAAAELIGPLLVLVAVITGPQPRYLTRWAWGLTVLTGAGILPYVLFSGSWTRVGEGLPRRRVNGWIALLALLVLSTGVKHGVDLLHEDRHPVPLNGVAVAPVGQS